MASTELHGKQRHVLPATHHLLTSSKPRGGLRNLDAMQKIEPSGPLEATLFSAQSSSRFLRMPLAFFRFTGKVALARLLWENKVKLSRKAPKIFLELQKAGLPSTARGQTALAPTSLSNRRLRSVETEGKMTFRNRNHPHDYLEALFTGPTHENPF